MTIGDRIKAARKKAGLTQAKLSEISGVAAISIHQYEAGKRHPQLVQIQALSNALNVPMSYLMGDKENEMKRQTKYQPTEGGIPFVVLAESAAEQDAMQRLAAYEDTGLEPEICAEYKKFEDEAVSKNVPFSRIVELMEAEAEGRLLVLPCKVGDTVYWIKGKAILEVYIQWFETNAYGWCACGTYPPMAIPTFRFADFGKTVFLTRAAAEAALAKEDTP